MKEKGSWIICQKGVDKGLMQYVSIGTTPLGWRKASDTEVKNRKIGKYNTYYHE